MSTPLLCGGNNYTRHRNVGIFFSWSKTLILGSVSFLAVLLSHNTVISLLGPTYFRLSAFYREDVHVAWIGAHCKPIRSLTQGQAINVCKLVSSSHLLNHLSSSSIKNSHLNSFFRSSHQLLPILAHLNCTQNYDEMKSTRLMCFDPSFCQLVEINKQYLSVFSSWSRQNQIFGIVAHRNYMVFLILLKFECFNYVLDFHSK